MSGGGGNRTRATFPTSGSKSRGPARRSEVIRVREQAPPLRRGEQLVARPGVSDDLPVCVESIPVHAGEDGVLAKLSNVGLKSPPCLDARCTPIRADSRSEVVPHSATTRHVNRLSPSNSKKRRVAKVGYASHIPFCIALDVVVQEGLNRGRHGRDCRSRAGVGQAPRKRSSCVTRIVEAAGIEPASVDAPVRTSTSVVRALASTAGRRRTPYRRSSHP